LGSTDTIVDAEGVIKTMSDKHMKLHQLKHSLIEELIFLCEVRGELDVLSNERNENRIAFINQKLKELE
jgi:hypothetical protein